MFLLLDVYIIFIKKLKEMYPLEIIKPMKEELTSIGFKSLMTTEQVSDSISNSQTAVLIVNSVCGCAAANARPGIKQSLDNDKVPSELLTVFAGVDKEATNAARELMIPFPPSSPCIALFKKGELVHMLERHHIEGRSSEIISQNLKQAYNDYC